MVHGVSEPGSVWITRVTFLRGDHVLPDLPAARRILSQAGSARDVQERLVGGAVTAINTAIRAHRLAVGDPLLGEVAAHLAYAARIGVGSADEVARGRFEHALEFVPNNAPRWHERLPSTEAVAAALAGRQPLLEADELVLRLAMDFSVGRERLAAVQLPVAIELMISEVTGPGSLGRDRTEMQALSATAAALAEKGRSASLEHRDHEAMAEVIRTLSGLSARIRSAAVLPSADTG